VSVAGGELCCGDAVTRDAQTGLPKKYWHRVKLPSLNPLHLIRRNSFQANMQVDPANLLNDLLLIYDHDRFVKFHCGHQVLCIDPAVLVDLVRPVLIVVKRPFVNVSDCNSHRQLTFLFIRKSALRKALADFASGAMMDWPRDSPSTSRAWILIQVLRANASMTLVMRGDVCKSSKIGSKFKRLSL
jgi:hypothetical protein